MVIISRGALVCVSIPGRQCSFPDPVAFRCTSGCSESVTFRWFLPFAGDYIYKNSMRDRFYLLVPNVESISRGHR